MIEQKGFFFRTDRCAACYACVSACRSEHGLPGYRRVETSGYEHSVSLSCGHCEAPECMRVCPRNAFSKRRDGIIVIDEDRCDGCGDCRQACPYEAVQLVFNPQTQEHKAMKCEFCLRTRPQESAPACVEACCTGALDWGPVGTPPGLGRWEMRLDGMFTPDFTKPALRFQVPKAKERYWAADNNRLI
ncbi:4Fe-4S dicluster domain-containing protein [Salisediminibacterium halotolerans]|uniref:Fe-S-cluster-containing dehydrogenase component n=1 Tax=Salisediminibacterium halotolerans TaxID=517425 RepID=A0A1H9QJC5_9BACI|nr:4Fe-4S dicluster domain-containing protein [Salisediminibacterium haloalkalitolerans]SER60562.1 Fe-S-cluster-containing dehydrogenase component [Salisediminibacterium haloalkalitolerans]